MHFLGDILHILGGFRGKFCLLGGHFGPGPRQDKEFLVEYTPMGRPPESVRETLVDKIVFYCRSPWTCSNCTRLWGRREASGAARQTRPGRRSVWRWLRTTGSLSCGDSCRNFTGNTCWNSRYLINTTTSPPTWRSSVTSWPSTVTSTLWWWIW